MPEVFNALIDQLVILYNGALDTASAVEFLNLAEPGDNVNSALFRMEWMLNDPFTEFSSPEELLLFQRAVKHAKAASLCSAYLQHYQNRIPPNRQLA